MGSDLVVFTAELFRDAHQIKSVGDVFPIQALVFQRLKRSLAHAVLPGSANPGTNMPQQRVGFAEVLETERAEVSTVVGDEHDLANLARNRVGEFLDQWTPGEAFSFSQSQLDGLDRVTVGR